MEVNCPIVEICPTISFDGVLDFFSLVLSGSFNNVYVIDIFFIEESGGKGFDPNLFVIFQVTPRVCRACAPKDIVY